MRKSQSHATLTDDGGDASPFPSYTVVLPVDPPCMVHQSWAWFGVYR